MADVIVTVVPREGADPRSFRLDDTPEPNEVNGGASMIATFKRQQARGELHSVTVTPYELTAEVPPKAVKKATKAAEVPAAE